MDNLHLSARSAIRVGEHLRERRLPAPVDPVHRHQDWTIQTGSRTDHLTDPGHARTLDTTLAESGMEQSPWSARGG